MHEGSTKRFQTIAKAAKATGIAEQLIRSWIFHGNLKTYPNPDPGNPEEIIDTTALLALAKGDKTDEN